MASGGDQRQPRNLQGLLKFCAEQTQDEDPTTNQPLAPLSDEKYKQTSPSSVTTTTTDKKASATSVLSPNKDNDENSADKDRDGKSSDKDRDADLSFWSQMEQARQDQDKALNGLGLYRFHIPGDGNCMFRATCSQLKLDQEKYHPQLREKAVDWMKSHDEELLAGNMLDNLDEIEETAKDGVWPSQAAIIALANVLNMNIAVVQGGDKGNIDIQHISPFETTVDKPSKDGKEGIILAYLYNGHYDGIVTEPKVPNPVYKNWVLDCEEKTKMGERLARKIERYGSSYGRDDVHLPSRKDFDEEERHFKTEAHRAKSPEFGQATIRKYSEDPVDTLSYRTRNLNLRDGSLSDTTSPRSVISSSLSPASSTSSPLTRIPVFHESSPSSNEWTSYTHEDIVRPHDASLDSASRYRSRRSPELDKPVSRVIPVQHISGHSSSRYGSESRRYGRESYRDEPYEKPFEEAYERPFESEPRYGTRIEPAKPSSGMTYGRPQSSSSRYDAGSTTYNRHFQSPTSQYDRDYPLHGTVTSTHRADSTYGALRHGISGSSWDPPRYSSSTLERSSYKPSRSSYDRKPHNHDRFATEIDYEDIWNYTSGPSSSHDVERRLSGDRHQRSLHRV